MYISLVALSCLIICSVLTVDAVRYYDPAGGSIQSETTGRKYVYAMNSSPKGNGRSPESKKSSH